MSLTQQRIISRLLFLATQSIQNKKHASAICAGGKILSLGINSHRNKFGKDIRCSGHSEITCIYNMFPSTFKHKLKKQYLQGY